MTEQQVNNQEVLEEKALADLTEGELQLLIQQNQSYTEEKPKKFKKVTDFIKKNKVTIGATLGGIAIGVIATKKLTDNGEPEQSMIEGEFTEINDVFNYSEGYESREEQEAE